MSSKQHFKYDLDALLEDDGDTMKMRFAESIEALMQEFQDDDLQIENRIKTLLGHGSQDNRVPSIEDQLKIREVTRERMMGRYKNDLAGFIEAVKEVEKNATFVE